MKYITFNQYFCDFEGVAYAIDKAVQNCSIIPIQNGSFDTSINVTQALSTNAFVMRMKSPAQIFFLDSKYTFEGQVCNLLSVIYKCIYNDVPFEDRINGILDKDCSVTIFSFVFIWLQKSLQTNVKIQSLSLLLSLSIVLQLLEYKCKEVVNWTIKE